MADFFSLDEDEPIFDEESSSLHRNCLKELALEQLQYSDASDSASDISEDLPEGTDWNSLPVVHKKHDRNVNEEPPIITPRELDERPRSARTAAGVRFAAAEQIFEQHGGGDNFDALRPRTAVSRGGGAERKEAKKFEFTAEGHMNDWHTAVQHEIEDTTNVKDAFPTPAFVRKSIDERARSATRAVVPQLNLAAVNQPATARPHDPPSSRRAPPAAASSSARSSSFTPRNSDRSRQRQREHDANARDFLDTYRQDLVAVFMGGGARRATKPPPKKKEIKKKQQQQQQQQHVVCEPAAPPDASEPSLGSTLRSTDRDTHAYTASPVAAAVADTPPSPHRATNASPPRPSSAHSVGRSDACTSRVPDADTADPFPPPEPHQPDTPRMRASTANIIEQAALSGIEDFDASTQAEERISAVLKRAQSAASPGKRRGVAAGEEAAPKAVAPVSHKSHMLPYLQSGRRPKQSPRVGGDVGEVDWQAVYTETDGRVLTDLISFNVNDGVDPNNKGQQLCKLMHVPKAFAPQVIRAAASAHGLNSLDHSRQLLCSAFQKLLEREALLQHINLKQATGAPTYADIVSLGRLSAVVAVKLKELRRSMFWIGYSRCFVWGKQEYEEKMAHDMEDVQLRF